MNVPSSTRGAVPPPGGPFDSPGTAPPGTTVAHSTGQPGSSAVVSPPSRAAPEPAPEPAPVFAPVFVAEPHTPEWYTARRAGIGASEIAAVLRISPWEARFSLWWRKREGWPVEESAEMEAGRRAEPVVADWFADRHTDVCVLDAGLFAHGSRSWQLATPDRLLWARRCRVCTPDVLCVCADWFGRTPGSGRYDRPLAALECKYVIGGWHGWGEPGTDDIPVWYRAQCQWQADVLGVDTVYLAAWHGADFREYVIRRDEKDLRYMRAAGQQFVDDLAAGVEPDVDEHPATLDVLRQLHPTVEDRRAEVTPATAEGYLRSRALRRRVDRMADLFEARLRHEMGAARVAVCDGRFIASRSVFDRTDERYELHALDTGWPVTDRLNPARARANSAADRGGES